MKNREVADILNKIADFLEMEEVQFKPRAYRKAAQNIESLSTDIEDIYEKEDLQDIPGVGKGIAKKIEEFIETGKIKKYEELKKETPVDMEGLSAVESLGPKKIKALYDTLKITNLDELEKAAKEGKIRNIEGFGETTEKNILENIAFARQSKHRFLLGYVMPEAHDIIALLEDHVDKIDLAGSLRRKKETIGDVDILAVSASPDKAMDVFTGSDKVEKVLVKGDTKSSVRLYGGVQVDLRIVGQENFGSAMQYFTGSKDHNIVVRKLAIKQGYKLNEYGLFEDDKQVAGETEEGVYEALGMKWFPPELREDRGEVDAALEGKLPKLVAYDDVKGDLQMHTKWSDGSNTVEEMVNQALDLGHDFIAITDHVGSLKVAGGMDKDQVAEQAKEIEKIQGEYDDIHIFHGVEANIMKDGSIDVGKDLLEQVDVVLGSVHSAFRMNREDMTKRVIQAIENEYVDIIAHPTCRMIQKREAINLDMEKVLQAASDNNTIMEINAYPERLDLNDVNVKLVVENNVKVSIGTDSHRKDHLRYYDLGTSVARRGWARKKDVINTYDVKKLRKLFSK